MTRLLLAFLVSLATATAAYAVEIGTVASLRGSAEIGRNGAWSEASAGSPLQQGDRIRTGNPGRVRIVFQDDSLLTLNDDTEIVLDESVFAPEGESRSLTSLLRGAVNAVVSEYYENPGSEYSIRTATATAGVRGTEFIMSYFPERELAEVIGISGQVEVRSTLADIEDSVYVTASEVSQVGAGKAPTPSQPLSEPLLEERLERFDFVGTTRIEDLAAWQGGAGFIAGGRESAPTGFVARQERVHRPNDAGGLLSDSPAIFTERQLGVRF